MIVKGIKTVAKCFRSLPVLSYESNHQCEWTSLTSSHTMTSLLDSLMKRIAETVTRAEIQAAPVDWSTPKTPMVALRERTNSYNTTYLMPSF